MDKTDRTQRSRRQRRPRRPGDTSAETPCVPASSAPRSSDPGSGKPSGGAARRAGAGPPEGGRLPPSVEAGRLLRRIRSLLDCAMLQERERAVRRMDRLRRQAGGRKPGPELLCELARIETDLVASGRERERRARDVPPLRYPRELPITARKDEIVAAIRANRAIIVAGETGCGKSTQLPKMCLEAGRGIAGRIGHTQPRRIAAITIAGRVAEELGEEIGRSVGYKIRFQDRTSPAAYLKVMTDGMLLAETQGDRRLTEYDTLIVDEAHERSLNIDFLLGIARRLLDERPELKLVITSATLDIAKFVQAFGDAPVIEVSGRTFPVDVEYRPPEEEAPEDRDYVDSAVREIVRLEREKPPGDVLVFMPTEQDILETVQRLEGRRRPGAAVLPLFARLPAAQQGRVYSVQGPKIVVATNVAETSLTIPGIKYVVDTGLARISQYQPGSHINALPIRPISRASADQRKGRCGRVQAGVCVRLYSEEDFRSRPEFTPPEILRSDLAGVVLRMLDLGLGDPLGFPFVDRPPAKAVRDGYETLIELGAVRKAERGEWQLTDRGRRMAALPLDPRLSRMLLEAAREDRVPEVAAIAAVLSMRDPRERPPDKAAQADLAHAAFRVPGSDFLTLLNLWNRWRTDLPAGASQGQRRKYCHDHFLSYPRMREWGFLHQEILGLLEERGSVGGTRRPPVPAAGPGAEFRSEFYASVHRSIVSGLLANIAVHKDKSIYTAAKNREAMLWPGSVLFGKAPAWIAAAEMVQTTRLYARTAGRIDPAWLEDLAGELCKRTWHDPEWDRGRGEVVARERVTLFGLEIVRDRRVPYGPVDPDKAGAIFVRRALVEGDMADPPEFLRWNLALRRRTAALEEKLRRRDLAVSDDAVAALYASRLPGVFDVRSLDRIVRERGDAFLRLGDDDLLKRRPDFEALTSFPDEIEAGGRRFPAEYRFAPGDEADGVTMNVPYDLLGAVAAERLEWGVPGRFRDKVEALFKGLPKPYRKLFVPVNETVETVVREMPRRPEDASLVQALSEFVRRRFRADVPLRAWSEAEVPRYLKMRVAVTDHTGRVVDAGRDVELLKRKVGAGGAVPPKTESPAWQQAREEWERGPFTDWTFGDLPESVPVGESLTGYPGLAVEDGGVSVRLFPTRADAEAAHVQGVQLLLERRFAKDVAFARGYHRLPAELEPATRFFGGKAAVEKAIEAALLREIFRKDIRTAKDYEDYRGDVVRGLFDKGHALTHAAMKILELHFSLRRELEKSGVSVGPGDVGSGRAAGTGGAESGEMTGVESSSDRSGGVQRGKRIESDDAAGRKGGGPIEGRGGGTGDAPDLGRSGARIGSGSIAAKETPVGGLGASVKSRGESWASLDRALAEIRKRGERTVAAPPFLEKIRDDLEALAPGGFLEIYDLDRLSRLPRYLEMLKSRLARARIDPDKDKGKEAQLEPFLDAVARLRRGIAAADRAAQRTAAERAQDLAGIKLRRTAPDRTLPASPEKRDAVEEFRWLVEEFKIALFAPEMKTEFPVSAVRLAKRLKEIEAMA